MAAAGAAVAAVAAGAAEVAEVAEAAAAATPVPALVPAVTADLEAQAAAEVNRGIQAILAKAHRAVVQTTRQEIRGIAGLTIRLPVPEAATRMIRWEFVEDGEPMIPSDMSVVTTTRLHMQEEMTTR